MASTSAAAAFYADFQRLKADVASALTASDVPTASAALSRLRTALADVRASLPAYDQRSYDLQVKELETQISAKRAPKTSKFAFKRAPKSASGSGTSTPAPTSTPPTPSAPSPTTTPTPSAPTYTLTSKTNTTLTERDISPQGNYTLTLSNLFRCIVDLRPLGSAALTSLHASNLRNCVLITPRMAGSAMLSELASCLVILGAQQFRLHHSTDSAIALSVRSLPVVEGCNGVVFGKYPLPTEYEDGDKYAHVQDFDWVRGGPSPNWRTATPEEETAIAAAAAAAAASTSDGADSLIHSIPCIQRYTNSD